MSANDDDSNPYLHSETEWFAHISRVYYHYEVATTVLFFVALLGAIGAAVLVFTRLQRDAGIANRSLFKLKGSSIIFIVYCILSVVGTSLFAYHEWKLSSYYGRNPDDDDDSDGIFSRDLRFRDSPLENAALYIAALFNYFGQVSQTFIYITIASFNISIVNAGRHGGPSQSSASKIALLISYAVGVVLVCLATALFGIACYLSYANINTLSADEADRVFDIQQAGFQVQLSFESIISAAALVAVGLAIFARTQTRAIGGKDGPALLAVWAGIFLLLSALYALGDDVHFTWLQPYTSGAPRYYRVILLPILFAWPMLAALFLLYLALRRWGTGAAGNQAKQTGERTVIA